MIPSSIIVRIDLTETGPVTPARKRVRKDPHL
jgi:hypothetical protein